MRFLVEMARSNIGIFKRITLTEIRYVARRRVMRGDTPAITSMNTGAAG
jgi:hypothetical protein